MQLDAVVIGGGPAGSLVALRLSRAGWRVALVERRPRAAPKTCGHCLSPRGVGLLEREGLLDRVRAIAAGSTHAVALHHAPGRMISSPQLGAAGGEAGLIVERDRFDDVLRDAAAGAGVDVIQPAVAQLCAPDDVNGERVVTVRRAGDRRGEPLRCRVVIGADGLGSPTARALGLVRGRPGRRYGFSFDARCAGSWHAPRGAIELLFAHGGYLGAIRQRGGVVHFGGLIGPRTPRPLRRPFEFAGAVAERFGRDLAVDRERVEHFVSCGPIPWRPRAIACAGGGLVGDAAGYAEPVTGEGITWAMESGLVLAGVLEAERPGTWSPLLAREYDRRHRRTVRRSQHLCAAIGRAIGSPVLAPLIFGAGAAHPLLLRGLVRRIAAPARAVAS